jgi:hypothetical protein
VWQQRRQHLSGAPLVIAVRRFDEGDGLGQRPSATGQDAVDEMLVGSRQAAGGALVMSMRCDGRGSGQWRCACLADLARTVIAESSMRVPGPKMALAPAWNRKS